MNRRALLWLIVILMILALTAMTNGCGSGGNQTTGARVGESSPWEVRSVDPPRTLTVGTGVEYCSGAPKPRIARPKIVYQDDEVLITLTVVKPPERPAKPGEACRGLELFVGRKIVLKRDLEDVEVFDGGVDPPLKRWPN